MFSNPITSFINTHYFTHFIIAYRSLIGLRQISLIILRIEIVLVVVVVHVVVTAAVVVVVIV